MTDRQLYKYCQKVGRRAIKAQWQFSGMLPEVEKRRLWEKKGFSSIFEFAARLAGMGRNRVAMALRLDKKYESLPIIHEAFKMGEVSPNKLERLAAIATQENQREILDLAKKLSKNAIEELVKNRIHDGLDKGKSHLNSLPGQAAQEGLFCDLPSGNEVVKTAPNFDFEIVAALSPELKIKIKELLDKGININDLLMEFLDQREAEIKEEKAEIAVVVDEEKRPATRHIPAKIKRIITKEYGTKCAIEGCKQPSQDIHHIEQFAISKSHDPNNLIPLCKTHHELEHMDDALVQKYRTSE